MVPLLVEVNYGFNNKRMRTLKWIKLSALFKRNYLKIEVEQLVNQYSTILKLIIMVLKTPLNQLCNINTNEASTIILALYDASVADEVVKSIQKSDLGFNPNNDDGVTIINVPPLTQERRQELVKFLNKQSEAFKVSVRNVRKEANDEIKKSLKNKEITEDQEKSGLKKIQDQTDIFIQK